MLYAERIIAIRAKLPCWFCYMNLLMFGTGCEKTLLWGYNFYVCNLSVNTKFGNMDGGFE